MIEGDPCYVKYLRTHNNKCKVFFHIHARLMAAEDGHLVDALEYSDRIIVVSNFIKNDFQERFGINPGKICVVHNCAGLSFFNRSNLDRDKLELKSKLGIDPTDFILIFAGRLVPDKGLLELVKACKRISNRISFKLVCLGSFGSEFGKENNKNDTFQEVVQNEISGLERNFIFCGFIPNDEMPGYYTIADVAIVPSLCYEAAGLVAIEAMSAALPVIYSNRGGLKEYVSEECGIMIDMGADDSVEKIALAIIKLYEDHELRKAMSSASYFRARKFSPNVNFENLNGIFTKIE